MGSLLGVLAVEARPDLYHAWIGSGQMVSPPGTDRMSWEDTLAWAEAQGDEALTATLLENGPPPYADILDYEAASHEHDWNPYPEFDNDGEMPATLFVPENTLDDQFNGLRAFLDTFAALYPRIQEVDLRQDATRLEVPVYLVEGAHEARGRAELADAWFEMLEAPSRNILSSSTQDIGPHSKSPAASPSSCAGYGRRPTRDRGRPGRDVTRPRRLLDLPTTGTPWQVAAARLGL